MSDVYFDYWPLSPASTEMDVLLVAARQQVVESRTTLLEDIGVHPVVCDVDGLALMKTIMRKSPALRGRSFGIVNVGASGMNLVFATDQDPLVVRDVTFEETRSRRTVDDEPVEETTAPASGGKSGPSLDCGGGHKGGEAVRRIPPGTPSGIHGWTSCFSVEGKRSIRGCRRRCRAHWRFPRSRSIPSTKSNGTPIIGCRHWPISEGVAVGLALHRDNHG